jgi:chromate transporter
MPERKPPSLPAITWVFLSIAMQSFGGGLSAWIRREIVQKRQWMEESTFVGGLALSQIAPGANSVNLAVFIGTTLRGRAGALAAMLGMLVMPAFVVLAMGAILLQVQDIPGVQSAMTGVGAAAIGMNAANGIRMMRKSLRKPVGLALMVAVAGAVGIAGVPLLEVLAVMVPVSLFLTK